MSMSVEILPSCQGMQPRHAGGDRRCRSQLAGEQRLEARAVELPVSRRSGVAMEEMRARIPADPAALHAPGDISGVAEAFVERDVKSAPVHMLAALGDAKGRFSKLGIGF